MVDELFKVEYTCGCVHEIERTQMIFKPTGNNKDCGSKH